MDYSTWAEMQQNPNPNPNPPFSTGFYAANYPQTLNSDANGSQYYTSNDPHNSFVLFHPRPPGVDQPYVPPPDAAAVTYAQLPIAFEPQRIPDAAVPAASYYPDPNVSFAAVITQLGATSYAAGGVTMPNPAIKPYRSYPKKKGPKKLKVVQSAWCEVCKISCNTKDVLDKHKLGKKHKKNLEKLSVITVAAAAPVPSIVAPPPAVLAASPAIAPAVLSVSMPLGVSTSAAMDKPIIGPMENPAKSSSSQKTRKKAAANEDLETKRRKIMEEGATAEALRTCAICNVVCNSEKVFKFHLAGQKHASMIKKHVSGAAVASAM